MGRVVFNVFRFSIAHPSKERKIKNKGIQKHSKITKMKIAILRKDGRILTATDYTDIEEGGEVAHILAELEIIKKDLLEIWEEIGTDKVPTR